MGYRACILFDDYLVDFVKYLGSFCGFLDDDFRLLFDDFG